MDQKVLDFDSNFEEAFKEYLIKNGLKDVYTMRETIPMVEERVEVKVEILGASEHHINQEVNNMDVETDTFDAVLTIAVSTERLKERAKISGYIDAHSFRVSLMRKLFLLNSLNGKFVDVHEFDAPEYYYVSAGSYKKAGESGTLQDEDVDLTFLSYNFTFQIKNEYWTL